MGQRPVSVTSVIKDFNFTSMRNKVGNLGITMADDSAKVFGYTGCYVYARLESREKFQSVVGEIEKIYDKLIPMKPFSYSVLEETYLSDFRTEQVLMKSLNLFTIIAIFISGFGLAALLMFQIANRMPEISVRKILGASSLEIGYLFFRELIVFVLLCAAISIPLSLYFVDHWFQSFPNRAALHFSSVLFGFAIVLFVVFGIGFIFVRKASVSNPIRFLRKE
jgi:putative ABC transport system permease protein